MKAVNLTLSPVELAPVNGAGLLAAADDASEGRHERKLEQVTDREVALARAGTIALLDAKGRRRRTFDDAPSPTTTDAGSGSDDSTGGAS